MHITLNEPPSTDQLRTKSGKTMVACVLERALANFAEEVARANDSGAKYCPDNYRDGFD